MLDLQPIKDRLEMASPDKGRRVGYPPDADLQYHAYDDLAALVAEVERLRAAIKAHRLKTIGNCEKYTGWTNSADRDLWILSD